MFHYKFSKIFNRIFYIIGTQKKFNCSAYVLIMFYFEDEYKNFLYHNM